jgi:hypothetical protein
MSRDLVMVLRVSFATVLFTTGLDLLKVRYFGAASVTRPFFRETAHNFWREGLFCMGFCPTSAACKLADYGRSLHAMRCALQHPLILICYKKRMTAAVYRIRALIVDPFLRLNPVRLLRRAAHMVSLQRNFPIPAATGLASGIAD